MCYKCVILWLTPIVFLNFVYSLSGETTEQLAARTVTADDHAYC